MNDGNGAKAKEENSLRSAITKRRQERKNKL
jgi:hypothetical protein